MATAGSCDVSDEVNEQGSKISLRSDSAEEDDKHRENPDSNWDIVMVNYTKQASEWPSSGQHILAQFDEKSVVVYQAFKPSIAEFAVKHQRFGGPGYSMERMSWIKTNFMWMMYRCGWAQKVDQERVLAVRITMEGFENILSKAFTGPKQKDSKLTAKDVDVRLQWDPDHSPAGGKLVRRAIQLGLKGKALEEYSNKHILNIKDITDFVHEQHKIFQKVGKHALMTPQERVYTPRNSKICDQIGLDFCSEQSVVSFET
uniref:DUF4291 domain-containing protein n=1 Tax=Arion vulgaris TaxID=1028688 RepID=A0A0B7BML8_9EUPU